MQVGIAYSEPGQQVWLNIEVPEPATVQQAIDRSGILQQFPHLEIGRAHV
jgi:putative ubiquitin-RnfH superfamily antitoxin RatB of RatAB toxin-antitoxin module